MPNPAYSTVFSASVSVGNTIAVGDMLVQDSTGNYVKATAAARAASGQRVDGIALTAWSSPINGAVQMQVVGRCPNATTNLNAGSSSWIRVSAGGVLERVAVPSTGDDVVGWCETNGDAHLLCGMLSSTIVNAQGAPLPASLTQTAWFIDSVAGNDQNDGLTSGTALKTWAQLRSRWGIGQTLAPAGGTVTVTLLNDMPSTDPVGLRYLTLGPQGGGVNLIVKGTTPTVLRSGSVTATTAINRATNTPTQITDGGIAGTWTTDLDRRVVLTSGASSGAYAWVAKDLGSKQARMSAFATPPAIGGGAFQVTLGTASVGNTYNVQRLTQCYLDEVALTGSFANSFPLVYFVDLDIQAAGLDLVPIYEGVPALFVGCRINPQLIPCGNNQQTSFSDCDLVNGVFPQSGSFSTFQSGLLRAGFGAESNAFSGAIVQLDGDVLCQGATLIASFGQFQIGTAAVFDGTSIVQSPSGAGISLGESYEGLGSAIVTTINYATHALYGSGNAGPGIAVGPQGSFNYQTNVPTVTGATGDLTYRGIVMSWTDPAVSDLFHQPNALFIPQSPVVPTTSSPAGLRVYSESSVLKYRRPDGTIVWLVGRDTTDTLTNKTINATNNTITDTSAAVGDILSIVAGTSFTRVAKGSNGTFWGVSGGVAGYYTPAAGTPGGSDTYVQYNNSGAFGGDTNFTYNKAGIATLTSALKIGASGYATVGLIRAPTTTTLLAYRGVGGSSDMIALASSAADNLYVGCDTSVTSGQASTFVSGLQHVYLCVGGSALVQINSGEMRTANNANLGIGTSTYGNGTNVMGFAPAVAVPNANPGSGVIVYSDTGTATHLYARDQNGQILDLEHGQVSQTATGSPTMTATAFASQIIKIIGNSSTTLTCPGPSNDAFGCYRIFHNTTNGTVTIASTTGAGTVAINTVKSAIVRFDSSGAVRVTADA